MLSQTDIAPYERKVLRRSYPAVTWMSARSWFVDKLANQNFYEDSHIVIVPEEVGRRQEHKAEQVPSPKNQQDAFERTW